MLVIKDPRPYNIATLYFAMNWNGLWKDDNEWIKVDVFIDGKARYNIQGGQLMVSKMVQWALLTLILAQQP